MTTGQAKGKPVCQLGYLGAIRCGVLPSELLSAHRATLESDESTWILRYQIAFREYGGLLEGLADVTIPIAAESYDDALKLAEVILREHTAPESTPAPPPEMPPEPLPELAVHAMLNGYRAA